MPSTKKRTTVHHEIEYRHAAIKGRWKNSGLSFPRQEEATQYIKDFFPMHKKSGIVTRIVKVTRTEEYL